MDVSGLLLSHVVMTFQNAAGIVGSVLGRSGVSSGPSQWDGWPGLLWCHQHGEPREETLVALPGPVAVTDTCVHKTHVHAHVSEPHPQEGPHLLPACRGEAQVPVVVCSRHLSPSEHRAHQPRAFTRSSPTG